MKNKKEGYKYLAKMELVKKFNKEYIRGRLSTLLLSLDGQRDSVQKARIMGEIAGIQDMKAWLSHEYQYNRGLYGTYCYDEDEDDTQEYNLLFKEHLY